MRIVLDTNVLVSALLSPHGAPAQVLRLVLHGDLVLLYDARLIAEYSEVLSRPKFGFSFGDIDVLVRGIERSGVSVVARPLVLELPDPDDLAFLEVAVAGIADALVTGNPRHYQPRQGSHGVEIVLPAELLRRRAQDTA